LPLSEVDRHPSAARVLAGLDTHLGPRVRVDLAEEGNLDLAREEQVLEPREAAAPVLLDVLLGQVADEITGHAHVEEKLAGAAALVEGEGLPRPDQVEGTRLAAGWPLSGQAARGRRPGRGLHRHRRGRGRLRAGLDPLQALGHRVHGFLYCSCMASNCLRICSISRRSASAS